MPSEAQKRAVIKYQKKTRYAKTLLLNRNTDMDIIDYIESLDNFSGYIKQLVREDMKNKSER